MVEPTAVVNRRAVARLKSGHRWIYRSDVVDVADASGGDTVLVRDPGGVVLGRAYYSAASQIVLRFVTRSDELVGPAFFGRRLEAAFGLRARLYPAPPSALRLVHAEADGLPGLIVDRYGDVLVVQTSIQATDRGLDFWCDWLWSRLNPRAIVERNDLGVRRYEHLPQRSGVVRGALEGPIEIAEGEVRLLVDPVAGQKTGAFLDQRENHLAVGALVRPGDRCLDVFTYVGGFALQMARSGGLVTAVDVSDKALAEARAGADRNGLEADWVSANAFDWLKETAVGGARFDMVVVDPPAFARSKKALAGALRGYKEVNLRAIQMLEPGGWLVTCSCSHNLSETRFLEVVRDAAADAGRPLQLVEKRGASRDHPVLVGVPETEYLKCLVLRALD